MVTSFQSIPPFHFSFTVPLSLKILGTISWFGSSPVSVAFVYQQPIYNCTATEKNIFRLNKFLVIHKKNLKIFVLFVQEIF